MEFLLVRENKTSGDPAVFLGGGGSNDGTMPSSCAVGLLIGPAGGCILGTDEHHDDRVIEHRATDEGCQTAD